MKKNSDILNKLRYETENANVIHLWLEGMFWKAYERSAYLFVHRVSEYKPYKKFIRAVGGEVVAIGFPAKKMDKLLEGRSVEYADEKHYILNGFSIGSGELRSFQSWKKSVPSFPWHVVDAERKTTPEKEITVRPEESLTGEVLDGPPPEQNKVVPVCPAELIHLVEDIRRFRIESATPLECMLFLSQLIKKSLEIDSI